MDSAALLAPQTLDPLAVKAPADEQRAVGATVAPAQRGAGEFAQASPEGSIVGRMALVERC